MTTPGRLDIVTVSGPPGPPGEGIGTHEASSVFTHIIRAADETARDALENLIPGQVVFVISEARYDRWSGSAWVQNVIAPPDEPPDPKPFEGCNVALNTTINVPTGEFTRVIFPTVTEDTGDFYNNVTGVFTLPKGLWEWEVFGAWDNNTSGNFRTIMVFDATAGSGFDPLDATMPGDSMSVQTRQRLFGRMYITSTPTDLSVYLSRDGSGTRTWGAQSWNVGGITFSPRPARAIVHKVANLP